MRGVRQDFLERVEGLGVRSEYVGLVNLIGEEEDVLRGADVDDRLHVFDREARAGWISRVDGDELCR